MLMAATVMMSLAANAQSSPEAKAIKKLKTYAEVEAAFKASGSAMSNEDKAFCYNKLAELAKKESDAAEKAAIEAQLAKNEAGSAELTTKKNEMAYAALANSAEAYALNEKSMKLGDNLQTLRNSMVQAGLDSYNAKNYAGAQKYFGMFVETRKAPLFSKVDFSGEQNFGQVCYYAALAAYFNKDGKKCSEYADAALASGEKDITNDVITVKLGALETMAQDKSIDTVQYINEVKKVYDANPDNEGVFGKLVGLYDDSGNKAGAKALLDGRLAQNPNDAMANAYVGQNAQSEGNYPEAIAAYTKAVQAKPDFLPAKLNLGVCYLNKAAADIDANTDARGNVKADKKAGIVEDLNKAKSILEEVKAADPDKLQVNWSYPLERVNYALDNVK